MFHFLRLIRKRLLTDNPPDRASRAGKFSKYLLYAVGEILLVVLFKRPNKTCPFDCVERYSSAY